MNKIKFDNKTLEDVFEQLALAPLAKLLLPAAATKGSTTSCFLGCITENWRPQAELRRSEGKLDCKTCWKTRRLKTMQDAHEPLRLSAWATIAGTCFSAIQKLHFSMGAWSARFDLSRAAMLHNLQIKCLSEEPLALVIICLWAVCMYESGDCLTVYHMRTLDRRNIIFSPALC